MAQTTYTSARAVTMQTRDIAYQRIAWLFQHADAYNVTILLVQKNADNTVSITTSAPIPAQFAADLAMFGLA